MSSNVMSGLAGHDYFDDLQQFEEVIAPFEGLFLSKGELKPTRMELENLRPDKLTAQILEKAQSVYARREKEFGLMPNGVPLMRELERVIMLRVVDEYWMEHIDAMHELRRGISLRGYGNDKPIDAYKRESFDMFENMTSGIRTEMVRRLFTVQVRKEQPIERKSVAVGAVSNVGGDSTSAKRQPVKANAKPGRNDPCPCGKMKEDGSRRLKYKECCGRNE